MSVIILRNEVVHYEVLGRGRPLIFLHGWVGSWRYWIPTMQAVSVSYRTYALDLWGFGDTAKAATYYSLDQQVELLNEFLNEMGIMKIAIIGHGLGAIIGLLYATHYREHVERVLGVGLPHEEIAINPRLQTASPMELVEWLLARNPDGDAALLEASKADSKAISVSLTGIPKVNLPLLLTQTNVPYLLVHGLNDPVIKVPPPERVISLPEYAHHILFEESGHFPMLEEPSKFNRLLTDFLSLDSGESPRQLQLKEEWKRRIR